ncbi:MAG TPA: hypothetical protein VMT55_00695 [Candidatus Sulfotelmatobacter sp.]|nr:hypothetical protein [Candidatus Sulfotelmatobacter sp.]
MPIEPISARPLKDLYQGNNVSGTAAAAQAQDEFLVIFYKELLKNAFQAPNLSPVDEPEKDGATNTAATFSSEIMVEQLAREMIKSGQLRPDFMRGIKQ